MTPADLKYQVEKADPQSKFFTRDTMKFFGDTMRNYGVCKVNVRTNWDADDKWVEGEGLVVECWELYRKRGVKHGVKTSTFFDAKTFNVVHGVVVP